LDKPLLIFDGDCGFCRVWIVRWKRLTRGRVDYAPSQEVGHNFPNIPPHDFQKSVQLIEPDGKRTAGAEAVFRALRYGGFSGGTWAYEKVPGFAPTAEFFYGIVAGNRPTFSTVTRWFWGNPATPSSYRRVRWLFLRVLAVIYGLAFASFGWQLEGLIGSRGILPAHGFLEHLVQYGPARYWYVPTLAWVNSSDLFLKGLCISGVVVSILVFLNMAPRLFLFVLWALYLSLVSIGGDFMSFQWDALLLETGFLAIFLAPPGLLPQRNGAPSPAPFSIFLLKWLLFRLMLQSALVKLLSGDPLWRHLTALTVHYQTQPLPNMVAWYMHQLPVWFQKMSCVYMFGVEGLMPLLIFAPRRLRHFAFWQFIALQTLIFLTGNYTYFNLLAMALCLPLLDDSDLRRWLPAWCEEPLTVTNETAKAVMWSRRILVTAVLWLTLVPFIHVLGMRFIPLIEEPALALSSLRSFNSYGLFAVMTPRRPEIILEGSDDTKTWKAYEFKFKPGDPARRPRQVAPYQPRLDWQMWFAALSDYRQNIWFLNLGIRLLEGSPAVTGLLANNPFPEKPPLYLRAMVYDYHFTTREERRQTGHWWVREPEGLYCPVLSLKQGHDLSR